MTQSKYEHFIDGKDQTIVRVSDTTVEILNPDMSWTPYQADLDRDYSPIKPENVQGLIDRIYLHKKG